MLIGLAADYLRIKIAYKFMSKLLFVVMKLALPSS